MDGFFAPIDSRSLALFRFLYCGSLAVAIANDGLFGFTMKRLIHHPELYRPIRLFGFFGIGMPSPEMFAVLYVGLFASLAAAAVGLLTRWALTASWIGFFLFYGTIYSARKPAISDKIGHMTDAIVFILLALSLSPAIGRWGVSDWLSRRASAPVRAEPDPVSGWPVQTAKFMLAMAYFFAVYRKLTHDLRWPDGLTVQTLFLERAMEGDYPLSLWFAHHRWLCAALSVATLLIEGTFSAVFIWPGLGWVYAGFGLGMHATMRVIMDMRYLSYFGAAYWAFLDWPALCRLGSRLSGGRWRPRAVPPAARVPPGDGLARERLLATAFMLFLVGGHAFSNFRWREIWPFPAYGFYAKRITHAVAVTWRIQTQSCGGDVRWVNEGRWITNRYNMKQFALTGNHEWLNANLRALLSQMPVETAREIRSIRVIERRPALLPSGRFEFKDTTFHELPIGLCPRPAATRPPTDAGRTRP